MSDCVVSLVKFQMVLPRVWYNLLPIPIWSLELVGIWANNEIWQEEVVTSSSRTQILSDRYVPK